MFDDSAYHTLSNGSVPLNKYYIPFEILVLMSHT
jgi:hypothetical protein